MPILDGLVLAEPVVISLRLAATERTGRPLTTAAVFAALARVDAHGDWSRLNLHLSSALAAEPDPDTDRTPVETWEEAELTPALAAALRLLQELCRTYDLVPAPVGAVALALVADPGCGAARGFLGTGLSHAELIDLIQSDLLGTSLVSLDLATLGDAGLADTGANKTDTDTDDTGIDWLERARGRAGRREPDELDVLAAIADSGCLPWLRPMFHLDETLLDAAANAARAFGARPAVTVVSSSVQHTLLSITGDPSPAARRTLWAFGVTGPEIAAYALWRQRDHGRTAPPPQRALVRTKWLAEVAAVALLVHAVLTGISPWTLLYLGILLAVRRGRSPRWSGGLAAAVALTVSPAAGLATAVAAAFDLIALLGQRNRLAAETAVVLRTTDVRRLERRSGVDALPMPMLLVLAPKLGWLRRRGRWHADRPTAPARPVAPLGSHRRTIVWRTIVALSILASAAGVLSAGRDPTPPPTQRLRPPYDVPAVAGKVLSTGEVRTVLRTPIVQFADGPPTQPFFTSASVLAADLRATSVVAGWQRQWTTADGRLQVLLRVVEARSHGFAGADVIARCRPTNRFALAGMDVAGADAAADTATGCARVSVGRTALYVQVDTVGKDAATRARATLRTVATAQRARLDPLPDLPPRPLAAGRNSINHMLAIAAITVPLLFAIPTPLIDRATRRRVSRLLRRRRRGPPVLDVVGLVREQRAITAAIATSRVACYVWCVRLAETLRLSYGRTAALLVAAFVITAMLERLIRRSQPGGWRPPLFRGRRRLLALVAAAITVAIAAAGILVILVGLNVVALGINPFGGAESLAPRIGWTIAAGGLLLIMLALVPITIARRLAMRALGRQIDTDMRPPILLLRSFADDRRTLRARRLDRASLLDRFCLRRWERFEEIVASSLGRSGPVFALGEPGIRLPPALGAVRRSFAQDTWRGEIENLVRQARVISVTVGRSESLLWEIDLIRRTGALSRTIFLLPPTKKAEQRRRLAVLSDALGLPWATLDVPPRQDVLAVVMPAGTTAPTVVTSDAPDDLSYTAAIGSCAPILQGAPSPVAALAPDLLRPALPRPKIQVYPQGKMPAYRPFYRRARWFGWFGTALLGVSSSLVFGYNIQNSKVIDVGSRTPAMITQSADGTVYTLLSDGMLARVNTGKSSIAPITQIDAPVSQLVVTGSRAAFLAAETGEIGVVDLSSGRLLWHTRATVGIQGLTVVGGSVIYLQPAQGSVRSVALSDGRPLRARHLDGIPWDAIATPAGLDVAMGDRGVIWRLDPASLAVRTSLPGPPGVKVLTQFAGHEWVVDSLEHSMSPVATGPRTGPFIFLESQYPQVSSNSGWVVVSGLQHVTTISPRGTFRRYTPPPVTLTAVCVTRDGKVFIGARGEIRQLGEDVFGRK